MRKRLVCSKFVQIGLHIPKNHLNYPCGLPKPSAFNLCCNVLYRSALQCCDSGDSVLESPKEDAAFLYGRSHSANQLACLESASKLRVTWSGFCSFHYHDKQRLVDTDAETRRLCLAAWVGDLEYLKARSEPWSQLHAFDRSIGYPHYHFFSCAVAAACSGRIDILDYILDHCKLWINFDVALELGAGYNGHLMFPETIFRRYQNQVPIHVLHQTMEAAAFSGHVEVLRYVMKKGGIARDPNIFGVLHTLVAVCRHGRDRNNSGVYCAFVVACRNGQFDAAKYLFPYVKLGQRVWQCAIEAARGGHAEILELFIPIKKVRGICRHGLWKVDPLTEAARLSHLPVARLLLEHGFNVNGYEKPGFLRTPLIAALMNGHEAMARLLLDNSADIGGNLGTKRRSRNRRPLTKEKAKTRSAASRRIFNGVSMSVMPPFATPSQRQSQKYN